jgi:protein-tyrosine-phosphatase
MTRVLFVCLGNICRSPMAEGIFTKLVQDKGLHDRFLIDAAGTAAYHVGELADRRTRELLASHNAEFTSPARRVADEDFEEFDLILAMDRSNLSGLQSRCPAQHQHKLHLALEPIGGADVKDPYYGGPDGFEQNYRELSEALAIWLSRSLDR